MASFFNDRKLLSWIIILIFFVAGGSSYFSMPRLEDPEFLIRQAQIVTHYPGASPEEITDSVVDVIETEIQGMQEVKKITSTAYYGYSIITVEINHQFSKTRDELNLVWTRLRGKIDNAVPNLPRGASEPEINDDYGDVFGLYYLITGDDYSIYELENYAKALRKDLLTVKGVAKVELLGEQIEMIEIEMPRDRVAAFGVSIADVFSDLNKQNSVASAGRVLLGDQRVHIYPTGTLDSVEDVANVQISVPQSNELVRLGDIATITRKAFDPAQDHVRFNGQPAIALGVSNISGANVAELGDSIRAKLNSTIDERPLGVEVNEFYHQGDVVNEAVESFALNVLIALAIVLITLVLFMGFRSALIIGFILTIIIAATLATINLVGIPMHRVSLGALIIALGMLVDNAIVITEGVLTGVRSGKGALSSARTVVKRTQWALLGGTIVGIIAFAPIGFAPGDTAEYTNHLFWVICISLLYSWIFAIGFVPMLATLMFRESKTSDKTTNKEGWAMRAYKAFLDWALRLRWLTVLAAFGLFMASLWGFKFVEQGFFPTSTTPQIAVDYNLPLGTDISRTLADIEKIEEHVLSYDEVVNAQSVVGGGALRYMLLYAPELPNSAYGQIIINVESLESIERLVTQIQNHVDENFPAAQTRVWRFKMGPSQGPRVEATFQGPNPDVLRNLAQEAQAIFANTPEATAIKTDWREAVPVVVPQYDELRGARAGISREDFVTALNANYSGSIVGILQDRDQQVPIVFRPPAEERQDLSTLAQIQVPSSLHGRTVPMSELMHGVEMEWHNGQIKRENRIWTLRVQADPIQGVTPAQLQLAVQDKIEAIELPPGYQLRWDGEHGDSAEANGELATTLPLGLLAMVLVVIVLFNAIRQAIVIWLIVPMSVIGVTLGLVVTGTPMEFMGILGLLSLSGLLIKNAIVLVDQMDKEIEEGVPRYTAVIDSAASRVRPVMMGALTTVLGIVPLIWDVFFASMAVVIAFGLAFATLLTLIILPALYAIIFRIKTSEV